MANYIFSHNNEDTDTYNTDKEFAFRARRPELGTKKISVPST
jgi:hypothetical protein